MKIDGPKMMWNLKFFIVKHEGKSPLNYEEIQIMKSDF